LKVELGGGKTGVIEVREGQNLRSLALDCCAEHGLQADKAAEPLEKHLQRKMAELESLSPPRKAAASDNRAELHEEHGEV
jgi:hypothetical protein